MVCAKSECFYRESFHTKFSSPIQLIVAVFERRLEWRISLLAFFVWPLWQCCGLSHKSKSQKLFVQAQAPFKRFPVNNSSHSHHINVVLGRRYAAPVLSTLFATEQHTKMVGKKLEDIIQPRWPDLLVKRPQLFFRAGVPNESEITESIANTAKVLGAKDVEVQKYQGWSLICSDFDWLSIAVSKGLSINEVFNRLIAFPEAGVNCHRGESLCTPFSSAVCTFSGEILQVIKGSVDDDSMFKDRLYDLKKWARVVAFKFSHKSE